MTSGTLIVAESVSGSLSANGTLVGNITEVQQSLCGNITPIQTIIAGTISAENSLSGEISGQSGLNGEITIPINRDIPTYGGDYIVTPKAHEATILQTYGLMMSNDVTVLEIPYYETSNIHGSTVYIANEV